MNRSHLLALIWALAIAGPLMNLICIFALEVHDNYWLISLLSPRDIMEVVAGIFASLVMPAAPFVILGSLGMQEHLDGRPTFGQGAILGCTIASAISMLGGWMVLWITVLIAGDNGASLGYWGMICSFPIFVPIFMLSGWSLGAKWDH